MQFLWSDCPWQPGWDAGAHSKPRPSHLQPGGHRPWGSEHSSCSCRNISQPLAIIIRFSTVFNQLRVTRCLVCAPGKTQERSALPSTQRLALYCFQAGFVLPRDIAAESSLHHRAAATSSLWIPGMGAKVITSAPSHGVQCSKETPSDEISTEMPARLPSRNQQLMCSHSGHQNAAGLRWLTLATHQVPKATLSLTSSAGQGRESCWVERRAGRDHLAIIITGKTASTWGN